MLGVAGRRNCKKRNNILRGGGTKIPQPKQKPNRTILWGTNRKDLTFSDRLAKSIVMRKKRFCMKSILFATNILGCCEEPFHISEMTSFS